MATIDTEELKSIVEVMKRNLASHQKLDSVFFDIEYAIHRAEAKEIADANDMAEYYGQGDDMKDSNKKEIDKMVKDMDEGVEVLCAMAPAVLTAAQDLSLYLTQLVDVLGQAVYGSSLSEVINNAFKVQLMQAVLRSGGSIDKAREAAGLYDELTNAPGVPDAS